MIFISALRAYVWRSQFGVYQREGRSVLNRSILKRCGLLRKKKMGERPLDTCFANLAWLAPWQPNTRKGPISSKRTSTSMVDGGGFKFNHMKPRSIMHGWAAMLLKQGCWRQRRVLIEEVNQCPPSSSRLRQPTLWEPDSACGSRCIKSRPPSIQSWNR